MSNQYIIVSHDLINSRIFTQIDGNSLKILITLQSYSDFYLKDVWPCLNTLSKKTGMVKKTVQNCINKLKKLGLISAMQRSGTSNMLSFNAEIVRNGDGKKDVDSDVKKLKTPPQTLPPNNSNETITKEARAREIPPAADHELLESRQCNIKIAEKKQNPTIETIETKETIETIAATNTAVAAKESALLFFINNSGLTPIDVGSYPIDKLIDLLAFCDNGLKNGKIKNKKSWLITALKEKWMKKNPMDENKPKYEYKPLAYDHKKADQYNGESDFTAVDNANDLLVAKIENDNIGIVDRFKAEEPELYAAALVAVPLPAGFKLQRIKDVITRQAIARAAREHYNIEQIEIAKLEYK